VRADSRPVRVAVVAVVAAAALVPVWASPVLVTTDGPSHVYNALVADAVLSERAPYARYLEFDRDWTRPDRTAQFLLMGLGRVVGFETAERVVFTLAVVATLAGFLALLVRSHSGRRGSRSRYPRGGPSAVAGAGRTLRWRRPPSSCCSWSWAAAVPGPGRCGRPTPGSAGGAS